MSHPIEQHLTRQEAAFIVQSLIISRSTEVSEEAKATRFALASKLELWFPGIIEENFGGILLR